jgi:hypothetical protein
MYDSILMFVVLITLVSLFICLYRYDELEIEIGIKDFKSPYFKIGVSFEEYILKDGYIEKVLTIGVFFFNITLVSWYEK